MRALTDERRRWLATRLLAFGGAALFALAAWAPWITGTLVISFGPAGVEGNTSSNDFSYDSSLGIFLLLAKLFRRDAIYDPETASRLLLFGWGGVTALGILIAPLLWQRLRGRLRRAPLYAFIAWLGMATLATAVLALLVWRYQPSSSDVNVAVSITARHVGWGLWLTLVGLAGAWLAVALLLREPAVSGDEVTQAARAPVSSKRRWAGVGLLTAGAVLWLLGFLAIPWIQVNCTSLQLTLNHLASGVCGELDSADALSSQLAQHVSADTWNLSDGIYPLYGALIGGALLLLVAVWLRAGSRIVATWATLWLAAASLAAFLAYRGVGVVLTHPPALTTEASGAWNGTTGVAVTLFGLLLGWLAILPLEGARWWSIGSNVPRGPLPPHIEADPFASSGDDFEVTRLPIRD